MAESLKKSLLGVVCPYCDQVNLQKFQSEHIETVVCASCHWCFKAWEWAGLYYSRPPVDGEPTALEPWDGGFKLD